MIAEVGPNIAFIIPREIGLGGLAFISCQQARPSGNQIIIGEWEMARLKLGKALESNGQFKQAKEALETAHKKAVQNSSPHLGIFADALDKINQKLRQEQ